MPSRSLTKPCADCSDAEASVEVRRRWLCTDCFLSYTYSKILKRLESYKLKRPNESSVREILLPLSGGISSLVLLHVLDQQLQRQSTRTKGRAAYKIHVLTVESPYLEPSPTLEFLNAVRDHYPSHTFSSISLSDISTFDPAALDSIVGASPLDDSDTSTQRSVTLDTVFESISTPTARGDILEILVTRLVIAFAKEKQMDSIFWGHSDSRLAAKALSSVAKGRGAVLPFQLRDGPTPWGISFNFPVRELFKNELEQYSVLNSTFPTELAIENTTNNRPISVRDLSIDQLITNYIVSQGAKYPSIMANVVRTAGKLRSPDPSESRLCGLCGLPVESDMGESLTRELCYGCARSKESVRSD